MYMVALRDRELLFFGDTAMNIAPDADALTDIALLTSGFVERLGIRPRIAMLSFSNFGCVRHPALDTVRQAVKCLKELQPDIEVDGEMQVDMDLNTEILRSRYPFSDLKKAANVLVLPGLASANSAYKLLVELGGSGGGRTHPPGDEASRALSPEGRYGPRHHLIWRHSRRWTRKFALSNPPRLWNN
jgi:malate dehydrogenase (oxaloacetate-decarboxylating)(NADP+)